MNRVYRLIWNELVHAWVPVSEHTRGRGKITRTVKTVLAAGFVAALGGGAAPSAWAVDATTLPSGGVVSAGSAGIARNGAEMTVTQQTAKVAINWQSFNIGSDASVTFAQPGAGAIAVNRVLGADGSQILGRLNANGQVWLLNPNGVLFGEGAQVTVGGLVASTLALSDADFLAGKTTFSGKGGSIVNQGSITAGSVALLGASVTNEGSIVARLGTVAMAAGDKITLDFDGDQLLNVQVDDGALKALVENRQLILADGGLVLMTARAKDAVFGAAVNNHGAIQANTIAEKDGRILLLGDMQQGEANVAGTLAARQVETSAAAVRLAPDLKVVTSGGHWLIDPIDIVIDAAQASVIQTGLGSGDVTISTAGVGADAGNIDVNASISWNQYILTLRADNDININAPLAVTGATAGHGLVLRYAQTEPGGTYHVNAPVDLVSGSLFQTQKGTDAAVTYTVITSFAEFKGINDNLAGNYAMGADITPANSATQVPIGSDSAHFTGSFDGLGHTFHSLRIRYTTFQDPAGNELGLFGVIGATGSVSNLGIQNGRLDGGDYLGLLAAKNHGTVSNVWSTGNVWSNAGAYIGGLVGYNAGTIVDAWSSAGVEGVHSGGWRSDYLGGLAGGNDGTIRNASAKGTVKGGFYAGGLVGESNGDISNAWATGNIEGWTYAGGLVGRNGGAITNVWATGNVSASTDADLTYAGGLVGYNAGGSISQAFASGRVDVENAVMFDVYGGGLVGYNDGDIDRSYAIGAVDSFTHGSHYIGGLVGRNDGRINYAYSTGALSASGSVILDQYGNVLLDKRRVGGLVGSNAGSVYGGYWDIDSTGQTTGSIGSGTSVAVGLSSGDAFSSASFSMFNGGAAWACASGICGTADGTWVMFEGGTRPFLKSEFSTTIINSHQLQLMALDGGASYTLGANVDASDTGRAGSMWNAQGFVSLGSASSPFSGSLDGGKHTIEGLFSSRSGDYAGLFAYTSGSAVIHDIGLVNIDIQGAGYSGGLVGYNGGGSIANAYVTGRVAGSGDYVGGLVGRNQGGSIANAHATADVTGNNDVGGLVGRNDGAAIGSVYASGKVSGDGNYIGGLIGFNAGADIGSAYASGQVSGNDYIGGLIGFNDGADIGTAYASGRVSGGRLCRRADRLQ